MAVSRIGVEVADLRMTPKDALRAAARMGFGAVELATVEGELAPSNLSSSGRRHLMRLVDDLGLQLTSLLADLPGLRLTDARNVDQRVEQTCQIVELARDVKVRVVTAGVAAMTHPQTGEPSSLALEALRRIGEFADSRGVSYAIRPAHDDADGVASVLAGLGCPAIRLCVDPAAMVMSGVNPQPLIERCAEHVVLVHARDGTAGGEDRAGHETCLGEGDVDLIGVLRALQEVDYRGPFILRRMDARDPRGDLDVCRQAMERLLAAGR